MEKIPTAEEFAKQSQRGTCHFYLQHYFSFDLILLILHMIIEKYLDGYRYTLSNENLRTNDEVYPILNGRIQNDGSFIIHDIEFESKHVEGLNTSGFPDEPHVIENLKHSDYKPYEVRTDHGFGPIEKYFKIIKIEKKIVEKRESGPLIFADIRWVDADIKETVGEMIKKRKVETNED